MFLTCPVTALQPVQGISCLSEWQLDLDTSDPCDLDRKKWVKLMCTCVCLNLYLVVLWWRHHEEYRRDPVETLKPLLPLRPLTSNVHHLERDLFDDKVVLDNPFSRLPCKQNVLSAWNVVLSEEKTRLYFQAERNTGTSCRIWREAHQLSNPIQVIQEVFDRLTLKDRRREKVTHLVINMLLSITGTHMVQIMKLQALIRLLEQIGFLGFFLG